MRFLLSSITLFLAACGSYPKKQNFEKATSDKVEISNPYFSDTEKDYVYRADIKVFKNSFSGIFIVKKLDERHHRIAFTTEMGNKIFDFEFQGENFKINHILPKMDKKVLINVLKSDFFTLIRENSISLNSYVNGNSRIIESELLGKKHYYLFENRSLNKIVRTRNEKEKVTFLFSEINDNVAKTINIVHKNIPLRIELNTI